MRIDSGGNLDAGFGGGDGVATVNLGSSDRALGAVLQSDQKILLTGYKGILLGSAANPATAVRRLNLDGSLDKTFNAGESIGGPNAVFLEGGSGTVLDSNVGILDSELTAGNYSNATLRLQRSGGANAEDAFSPPAPSVR